MEGVAIKSIHLSITGVVPGVDAAEFEAIVNGAEKNCLISKVLNIEISSAATLVS